MLEPMTAATRSDGTDAVFRALADPTRRSLLDRLRERSGQTLGELCAPLAMTRQAATQHLGVLEEASLVTTVRDGRRKLHYLNPVPIHELQARWIAPFEQPRLDALQTIRHRAEGVTMTAPDYVYVTYIESTPERVWEALTDADLTASYWGHRNESDWQVGSRWDHVRIDGSGISDVGGFVLESDPPRRLVTSWMPPDDERPEIASRVTFEIEPDGEIVRLTVTHQDLPTEQDRRDVSHGWPAVLANLKTLLETGHPLPREPWLKPAR
jgi:uncharacterized protein YndB with AHSA1/START domain/DNA-binding transcriptional ArsR family regulator